MASGGDRRSRVAEAMRDELSLLIARDIKDPRVTSAMATIGAIELNRDLSVAHISVSVLVGDGDAAVAGLQRAAGFLRGPLARRLKLRVAPDLRFHLDRGHAMARKLGDIVREDDQKRREAEGNAVHDLSESDSDEDDR